jgi:hypothetical protein
LWNERACSNEVKEYKPLKDTRVKWEYEWDKCYLNN